MTDDLVTIPDVEILRVGNWHSGLSGRVPITADDLQAMIDASTDLEVDASPLKIGHVDPRFDGEPALGWLKNLRNVNGTLIADITDAPAKMQTLIRSGFKRRSAEIAWGVKTPAGKTYRASLAGLALLGVTPPAVKGLADVLTRYSAPDADVVDTVTVVDGDDGELAELHATAINAGAAYQARVEFLSGGSGNVYGPAPDHRRNAKPLEGSVTDEQVREALGLPGDMPVTDQLRSIGVRAAEQAAADTAAAAAKVEADAKAEQDRVAAEQAATAAAAAQTAPTTAIDRGALEALQAQAAQGAEAMRILDEQDRERELTSALSAGKIAPSSVAQYRDLWATSKEQTKALLAGLPVVFSTVTQFSGAPTNTGQPATDGGFTDEQWGEFTTDINAFMRGKHHG